MKTKLTIQFEIDEDLRDTEDLIRKCHDGKLKIRDIFDPNADVFVRCYGGIHATQRFQTLHQRINGLSPKEPKPTNVELIIPTRGIFRKESQQQAANNTKEHYDFYYSEKQHEVEMSYGQLGIVRVNGILYTEAIEHGKHKSNWDDAVLVYSGTDYKITVD